MVSINSMCTTSPVCCLFYSLLIQGSCSGYWKVFYVVISYICHVSRTDTRQLPVPLSHLYVIPPCNSLVAAWYLWSWFSSNNHEHSSGERSIVHCGSISCAVNYMAALGSCNCCSSVVVWEEVVKNSKATYCWSQLNLLCAFKFSEEWGQLVSEKNLLLELWHYACFMCSHCFSHVQNENFLKKHIEALQNRNGRGLTCLPLL